MVNTDYFTKWIKVEPLARIRDNEAINFVWKRIIMRFDIRRALILDNNTRFDSRKFKDFYRSYSIRNYFALIAYPQCNGLEEVSNKTILDGIKKRSKKAKGCRANELHTILLTRRTNPRTSIGEIRFALMYGMEAIIPLEIGLPTMCSYLHVVDGNKQRIAR